MRRRSNLLRNPPRPRPARMNLPALLIALTFAISSSAFAQAPKDQTRALSELAQIFYQDRETLGRELLDPRKLDYSVESLRHVDAYLEAVRKNKDLQKSWNRTVLRAGAYVGEVIRRNDKNAQWHWVDHDGAQAINPKYFGALGKSIATAAVLFDGKGGFAFPLEKVEKYLDNGSADSVYFFAQVVMGGRSKGDKKT